MDNSRKEAAQARREELKELSKAVKPLIDEGKYQKVNEAIIAVYKSRTGATEFKTFKQWKKDGKSVKKGESAFAVWGRPKESEDNDEEQDFKYWPMCYLFNDTQVA